MDESTAQVWKLSAMDMGDDDIDLVEEYVFKTILFLFQQRNPRLMSQQLRCRSCLLWIWEMMTLIL